LFLWGSVSTATSHCISIILSCVYICSGLHLWACLSGGIQLSVKCCISHCRSELRCLTSVYSQEFSNSRRHYQRSTMCTCTHHWLAVSDRSAACDGKTELLRLLLLLRHLGPSGGQYPQDNCTSYSWQLALLVAH
jgi:hypothetical protein